MLAELAELAPDQRFQRMLVWPSPIRAAARAELAAAALRSTDDGVLICAQHNALARAVYRVMSKRCLASPRSSVSIAAAPLWSASPWRIAMRRWPKNGYRPDHPNGVRHFRYGHRQAYSPPIASMRVAPC